MAKTNPEAKQKQSEEDEQRKADVTYRRKPNAIADYQVQEQTVFVRSENDIELRVTVHTPEIIQLRYVLEGDRPTDFSYAIAPDFNPDNAEFSTRETDQYLEITTDSLICKISQKDMKVSFLDSSGTELCKDAKPFHRKDSIMKGITEVKITKEAPEGTHYFGLGDKITDDGMLRGKSFQNWNTDAYAYELDEHRDPLYRSIPFFTAINKDGNAYGIFMDNTFRSHFDFDSDDNNTCTFSAEGGCMNYYFIYGPDPTTVTERYTTLTGTPELPPLWGLGYHQCRWSYYPEERVRTLAKTFREKEIPCDALYLDIDYMDDYRVFTWNNDRFPDPKKLISDLKEDGFETIVMIDPGIKVDGDYEIYQQGLKNDYFCKRPDGELMIGPVWPPKTVFPDYTHPEVRQWWGDLYKDLLTEKGVSGVWNDMNEPAVFEVKAKTFPDNIRHHYEGEGVSHKKAHNIYGMQMARASYKGIKKHNQGKRPFLLTRANFSGGQRYAALWTGDNIANWEHLRHALEQCVRLSISGYSFVGTDIGGFVEQPSAELFTRWLQLGIFHPLFRNHTMGYDAEGADVVKEDQAKQKKIQSDDNQEPWTFGQKYTHINRSVIELRYRLLHYLYTAFHKYVEHGTPILRPTTFHNQVDAKSVNSQNTFMFGDHILVAPVIKKGARGRKTYLPSGHWYDYRTNELLEGGKTHQVDAPISEIPFFIKAGTVLPLREVMQYTQERDPELLELNVYYGTQVSESHLYEDQGEGFTHNEGDYRLTKFQFESNPQEKTLRLSADREGAFTPKYDTVKINLIGLPFEPEGVEADGRSVSIQKSSADQSVYAFEVDPDFKTIRVY
ncbi:glycoside hydrolase family 31 protein [Fodinibius sp.]|uniref:glycoside hydrolase family 31 protein n=1 Tax=Fodinibius sp. TaxID=1872440 RepID=UPI002ACDDA31|nr:glycoside hydrolase family 31 protein [Fodinibius sp.]MDZ7658161.1 glycoside hydrolase family 31 protein [Fodinibius sp.]